MRPIIDETYAAVNDAPTLPYDLVEEEILCRLPVKFLLQLRCVCKSWNSLISDPKFAKKHLSMSTTHRLHFVPHSSLLGKHTISSCPLQCIFTTSCRSKLKCIKRKTTVSINVTQLEYPSYRSDYRKPHVFVGSCNGILCLVDYYSDDPSVVLWNPSLRKVKELPKQPRYPNLFSISYGFGYDFVTDNYKVVAVLRYDHFDIIGGLLKKDVVMINTLGTNFWKNIQEFPFDSMIGRRDPGKFVSGKINWLASKSGRKSQWFIVSLDLGTESYQKFLLPDYGEVYYLPNLCVLRDCLCLISDHDVRDVWIMKEYGNKESWTKLFSVSNILLNAVYMFEDGQVLFRSYEKHDYDPFKMIVHDPRIGTIKYIKFQDKSVYNSSVNHPIVCIESLISPCF